MLLPSRLFNFSTEHCMSSIEHCVEGQLPWLEIILRPVLRGNIWMQKLGWTTSQGSFK